ncbi:conserved hypothetical protein [Coccidioides posadasii str. Silveira]|uniref:Uncharacterized protein n=1 Tax=Coccidioides posadasii (strain RMSCC 757 / Silveira) TaxID=443226 RepID=E9CWL2_COCPS|nr:conserved hypothetical protein [Coccidioides posadasii str. Silveira]
MGWISNLQQYPRKNNRLPYSLNAHHGVEPIHNFARYSTSPNSILRPTFTFTLQLGSSSWMASDLTLGYKESVSHEETIVTSPIPISQISILQLLHTLISHIPYGIARYGLPLGGYYKDS